MALARVVGRSPADSRWPSRWRLLLKRWGSATVVDHARRKTSRSNAARRIAEMIAATWRASLLPMKSAPRVEIHHILLLRGRFSTFSSRRYPDGVHAASVPSLHLPAGSPQANANHSRWPTSRVAVTGAIAMTFAMNPPGEPSNSFLASRGKLASRRSCPPFISRPLGETGAAGTLQARFSPDSSVGGGVWVLGRRVTSA